MESVSKRLLTDAEKKRFIAALIPHLAILRTQAEVSQEELANLIGVSRQTYSAIERKIRKMSWNTYLSMVLFYDHNQKTHRLMRRLSLFPTELIVRFNEGVVFLHEDLSYEEKLMVLAHEEGNIYCNHFTTAPILGRDVVEEHEANEFAHYLLHRSFGRRAMQFLGRHKRLTVSVAAGVLLVFAAALLLGLVQREQRYYGKYYITATGNKYHTKDCSFVRHKDNAERLTVEQFESSKYTPCDKCLTD